VRKAIACFIAVHVLFLPAFGQSPLPARHWALGELDSMARRGLVKGYPAGPLVVPADLTRHEAAGLVMRAVGGVAAAFQQAGGALEQAGEGAPPVAEPEGRLEAPPQVRMEDLARLEKLIAEFRTELVTLGTDVAKLSRAVSDLRKGLEATKKQVQAVAEEQKRHHISGYIQARWTDDQAADPHNEFSARRVRLRLSGPAADSAYAIEIAADNGTSVALKDAFLSRAVKGWEVRAGQLKVPFGFEVPQSPADALPPELAATTDRLFPDQRDRGIVVLSPPGKVQGIVGVVNGTGIKSSDIDNQKDVVARLVRRGRHANAGVSGYIGRWGGARKRRLGGDLRWTGGRAAFQGEYIRGHGEFHIDGPLLDSDVAGWYAQFEWNLSGRPGGTLFGRREQYDPNTDAPGDMFTRTTLGWAWQPDPANRLTAAAEFKNDPANGGAKNALTLQWQLLY